MYSLKPPRVGGPAQLCLFVADVGGVERAARILDVTPATLRRWMRDGGKPPQSAMQALYWLTRWGFEDAFAEAHWTHQALLAKVRQLEEALSFKAPARRAANEPTFHQPPARAITGWRRGGPRWLRC